MKPFPPLKTFPTLRAVMFLLSLTFLVESFSAFSGQAIARSAQHQKAAAATGNTLSNPSFESGLSPWQFMVKTGGGGAQSQDTSTHAQGSSSEMVTISQANASAPWDVQLLQSGISLTSGQQITISFFAKAASARSIQVVLQQNASPYMVYDQVNFSITSDWEAYSFTFTPTANDSNALFVFNLDGDSPTVWLDSAFVGVPAKYFRGLNIFGAWQSGWGGTDAWANSTQMAYYANHNLKVLRYPLLWDALQPTLGGALDSTYLAGLDGALSLAHQNGERVSLTFINQGRRPANNGNPIGSSAVPLSDWTDVWTKLVQHIIGNATDKATVWAWDLDNEPYNDANWQTNDAQATINAIRAVDTSKPIIAMPLDEGIQGYKSANNFQGYKDPAHSLWYEDHIYFDPGSIGAYQETYDQYNAADPSNPVVYPTVGIDYVQPFVDWCNAHPSVHCLVGETGIPGGWASGDANYTYDNPATALPTNDSRWNDCLNNLLTYLDQQGISSTYWNAGPYGDINSVEPALVNGQEYDRPQLQVLENHLGNWQP